LKTIAVIGDPHSNSTVGLCKPSINLDDGGTYQISKGQRWLWGNWLDFLERVEQAKPDIIVFNGDTVEGDAKGRSYQVITRNKTNAISIAADTLDPLCQLAPIRYFIRGTAAHGGKSGNIEEDLAKDLGGVKVGASYSHWELHLNIENVLVHIAHHTSMSGIPWRRKDAANILASRIVMEYALNKERPPDLAIRNHVHRFADSNSTYPTRAVILGAWQLATEFTHKISPDSLSEIGGGIFHFSAGTFDYEKIEYKPKGRTWTKI
jgi:3',5'-cyclic AMP phosphodiesterase CpdA